MKTAGFALFVLGAGMFSKGDFSNGKSFMIFGVVVFVLGLMINPKKVKRMSAANRATVDKLHTMLLNEDEFRIGVWENLRFRVKGQKEFAAAGALTNQRLILEGLAQPWRHIEANPVSIVMHRKYLTVVGAKWRHLSLAHQGTTYMLRGQDVEALKSKLSATGSGRTEGKAPTPTLSAQRPPAL